jgi:hypothetical protein
MPRPGNGRGVLTEEPVFTGAAGRLGTDTSVPQLAGLSRASCSRAEWGHQAQNSGRDLHIVQSPCGVYRNISKSAAAGPSRGCEGTSEWFATVSWFQLVWLSSVFCLNSPLLHSAAVWRDCIRLCWIDTRLPASPSDGAGVSLPPAAETPLSPDRPLDPGPDSAEGRSAGAGRPPRWARLMRSGETNPNPILHFNERPGARPDYSSDYGGVGYINLPDNQAARRFIGTYQEFHTN